MSTYIQTWDHQLVPIEQDGTVRGSALARPVLVEATLAEDVEARLFQPTRVPVEVRVDDTVVTDGVELGVGEVGATPLFFPAFLVDGQTCLLTTSLEPGRYAVYARCRGQVVRATPGVLRVR